MLIFTVFLFRLTLLVFSFFLCRCNKWIIYSGPIPKHGNINECIYLYIEIAVRIKDDDTEILK